MKFTTLVTTTLATLASCAPTVIKRAGPTCTVQSAGTGDSVPPLLAAIKTCGYNKDPSQRGKITIPAGTYNMKSIMTTTGLQNVDIEQRGTLLWDTNTTYWLKNSLPVGYQNQSTAWIFGGSGVNWYGFKTGTLNGNGQAWYNLVNGQSNYPRRPHAITFMNLQNSVIDGLQFINSQMWTMTIIKSKNVLLSNIYVNSTSATKVPARNTDGADTMFSDNITFRSWTVVNGDDSISCKANSTNILIENSTFYKGLGLAMGSIGQYNGQFETIQNITARNNTFIGTRNTAYIKTWTGVSKGYPPNGGGGGLGFLSNFTVRDSTLQNAGTFSIGQCTNFEGGTGDCDTSLFNIRDIKLLNWQGTVNTSYVATMKCSADSPCNNINIDSSSMNLQNLGNNNVLASKYTCRSLTNPVGFTCNA